MERLLIGRCWNDRVGVDEDAESGKGASLPQSPQSLSAEMAAAMAMRLRSGPRSVDSDFDDRIERPDMALSLCGILDECGEPPEDLFLQVRPPLFRFPVISIGSRLQSNLRMLHVHFHLIYISIEFIFPLNPHQISLTDLGNVHFRRVHCDVAAMKANSTGEMNSPKVGVETWQRPSDGVGFSSTFLFHQRANEQCCARRRAVELVRSWAVKYYRETR